MYQKLILLLSITILLTACATLPDNNNRQTSFAFTDTADTRLGQDIAGFEARYPGQDGFLLLVNGLDAFVARAGLTRAAERSLDVQYYLYHDDLVGRLFSALLWEAAERGVRVRLLVDDMDLANRDQEVLMFDAHPNIEVRIFNPFSRKVGRLPQYVSRFGSVTRRMHNKSFTADNAITIVGGRNIGDEYFDADPVLTFADLDIMAGGPVAAEVSASFDRYWNSKLAYPAATLIKAELSEAERLSIRDNMLAALQSEQASQYMQSLRDSDLAQSIRNAKIEFITGQATVVADDPDKILAARDEESLQLRSQLGPYFNQIESDLIVISPYFVPGKIGVEFFKSLVERGVRVRILTNSLASNDVSLVHVGYSRYRKALLRHGVELFELNNYQDLAVNRKRSRLGSSSQASLHAKTFILDQQRVFIGSLNLDPRSFLENTEIGLVIDSERLAKSMVLGMVDILEERTFKLNLETNPDGTENLRWQGYEEGRSVSYDKDPYTGFWERFWLGFFRLLPIESQL
ncbi:MAG: phospholipase D family protein [Gammaproteobacteria bacterium]|nr:phospholipase D family protein [Gammaproteobacteria bacterium]